MSHTDTARRTIPVLWLVLGIPLATIAASAITLWLAVTGAEPELPAYYYSEGLELDADLARARRAVELGIGAELHIATHGAATLALSMDAPGATAPEALTLRLTHATLPHRDRSWLLRRGADGLYRGQAPAPGDGPWLVQLDAGEQWRLRGRLTTTGARLRLGHGSP